ncbi:hypothetical protein [Lysobacter silvisoli]|uniref:Uncharacterized protein n=1 Tax=Lysobacter silvisoli TaxID=2293254 RepID=A0A371K2E8_9GAMM|nr:hypothetical protein [Lysobacter silvisoli]RDZ28040.1 hypothetical protein DX914_02515 [Lysobacter silvisoli]
MAGLANVALLLVALMLPVTMFLLLKLRTRMRGLLAAAVSVAAGWAFNVAYAYAVQTTASPDASQSTEGYVGIAALFGWACPTVLVLVTWLVLHLVTRRRRNAESLSS